MNEIQTAMLQVPKKKRKKMFVSACHEVLTNHAIPQRANGQKLGLRKRKQIANVE